MVVWDGMGWDGGLAELWVWYGCETVYVYIYVCVYEELTGYFMICDLRPWILEVEKENG